MASRAAKRELAQQLVSLDAVALSDVVTDGVTPEMVDGELLPPLLPHAWMIVTFGLRADDPHR